jgi:hypothetical protein
MVKSLLMGVLGLGCSVAWSGVDEVAPNGSARTPQEPAAKKADANSNGGACRACKAAHDPCKESQQIIHRQRTLLNHYGLSGGWLLCSHV